MQNCEQRNQQILILFEHGWSRKAIAEHFGLKTEYVGKLIKEQVKYQKYRESKIIWPVNDFYTFHKFLTNDALMNM
jgi:hypothetical protein